MKNKLYKIVSVALLAGVMATIFLLSHQNGVKSTETSGFITRLLALLFGNIPEIIVRTLAHFSEFCALGFLMANCIHAFTQRSEPLKAALLSWGYAWTDEIHQIFIDGRAFQLFDLLVDLAGIVLGVALITAIIYISAKIKERRSR